MKSMILLETKRTYLREITADDAEKAYLLNLDSEVIKYTGDSSFESIDKAREFLEDYDHYKKYGFGRWGVIDKTENEFLGWCGLKYTKELDEFDIGFRFFKKYWNMGYATETAKACIDLGFEKLGITEIVGRARKENIGSIRVLEKIGLVYSKHFNFDGQEGVIYKIEKNKWKG
ncbi:MAG: GNAT family N-acetyltransferase [Bacteroidetes bacterium B1(2017)]|nr:MAG: GNAT family N-acetyltransferase [Bacteroidetes bacterium B1(2017)]